MTKLCLIRCADGTVYTIRSGIKATLIEANARLAEDPQLLKTSRDYAGFIAIVIPPAMMNNERNLVPSELGKPVRYGTDVPFVPRSFAAIETKTEKEEAKKEEDDGDPEAKRPKLDE